ncbi:MAG: CoA-binding protein [Thermoprotei archaeon]|nr:MAG: CoA-binding protein [Thermoprotei archaeon]
MNLYEQIHGFFNPKSIAVIGASSKPGKIGYAVLKNLLEFHRKGGKVYPINPRADTILGLKVYKSILDVPENVDMAVIIIRSEEVPKIIEDCAKKGVKNIVIISGGFKELGGKYRDIEAEIAEKAKIYGIRIIGPNCIGVYDPETKVDTFFQPKERMLRPRPGNVAFLTQSGTYGIILLEWAAMDGLGVSKFVSYGNKVDVDEADLILYLKDDPQTKVIGIYLEGLGDGRKFFTAAKEVTKVKPIIILRGGWSEAAARAALSHTGFLGGKGRIYESAFKQSGVIIARNLEELYDMAKALAKQPAAKGPKVAMVSNGAGPMVQAVDLVVTEHLELSNLTEETKDRLRKELSPYTIVENPVDLTGSATPRDYETALNILLEDSNVDMVFVFFVHQNAPMNEEIVDVMRKINDKARRLKKPVLAGAAGGPYTLELNKKFEEIGIPTYPIPDRLVAAAKALYLWGRK